LISPEFAWLAVEDKISYPWPVAFSTQAGESMTMKLYGIDGVARGAGQVAGLPSGYA
jgi:hypothetical protein